jgi:hypothetical protein
MAWTDKSSTHGCSLDQRQKRNTSTIQQGHSLIRWIGFATWCTVGFFFDLLSDPTTYSHTDDPDWDAGTYNRLDAKAAAEQNPFNIQTWNGDLSAFQAAGGKLREFQ